MTAFDVFISVAFVVIAVMVMGIWWEAIRFWLDTK